MVPHSAWISGVLAWLGSSWFDGHNCGVSRQAQLCVLVVIVIVLWDKALRLLHLDFADAYEETLTVTPKPHRVDGMVMGNGGQM